MKIKQISFRDIIGSIINYPQESLPENIWDKRDNFFILKPKVKNLIQKYAKEIMDNFKNGSLWFKGLFLGSSIASQFYNEETDIDVKIFIDIEKFKKYNPQFFHYNNEDFVKETKDIIDEIVQIRNFKLDTHPFEFIFIDFRISTDKEFIGHFDSLYDVDNDYWIKKPKLVDIYTYDRDKVVEEGERLALKWATQWDLDLGKIKRHVKEFDLVNNYINGIKEGNKKQQLKNKLENLLKLTEKEIDKLHDEKKIVTNQRHRVYIDYQDDIEKYYGMINAHPEVIQLKYLAYWGYLKIIKELSKITKEEDLNKNNIENVKKVIEKESV